MHELTLVHNVKLENILQTQEVCLCCLCLKHHSMMDFVCFFGISQYHSIIPLFRSGLDIKGLQNLDVSASKLFFSFFLENQSLYKDGLLHFCYHAWSFVNLLVFSRVLGLVYTRAFPLGSTFDLNVLPCICVRNTN